MATVKKHVSKDGIITYYIRVFNGFDGNGKKIELSLAWKVPEGMKPKQIERLNHKIRLIAIAFQVKMLYNRYRTGGMTYGSESG